MSFPMNTENESDGASANSIISAMYNNNDTNTSEISDHNDIGDHSNPNLAFGCQTKKLEQDTFGMQTGKKKTDPAITEQDMSDEDKDCLKCKESLEPYCHVKLDALIKLKDSTKKIICLLEEIQGKTHCKNRISSAPLSNLIRPLATSPRESSITEVIGASAIRKLETHAKTLDDIYIQDEDDDCSIYKRLTRKCHCLNQQEYNDLIIHFNEDTRYFTSTVGEIIKNIRIVKKFLYMGGTYTKNALQFLNEGFTESARTEKIEIIQGCSHSDLCNVFEDHSIVTVCISWPCTYETYGDSLTQALAAGLLNKIAQLEEGRRYLKYSSKITNDIKKTLRKKASKLEYDVTETLNDTLNLLHPPIPQHVNITFYCKPVDEGFGQKTMNCLIQYRQYMTLDEVFNYLDLLNNFSNSENGQVELAGSLPVLLRLFKHMLMEYDNSEMNIIVTNILNNIVPKTMIKEKEKDPEKPKVLTIADTATEPIKMKNESNQVPVIKKQHSKKNKSKVCFGLTATKFHPPSGPKEWESSRMVNHSRKFIKDKRSIIVVPIEK